MGKNFETRVETSPCFLTLATDFLTDFLTELLVEAHCFRNCCRPRRNS